MDDSPHQVEFMPSIQRKLSQVKVPWNDLLWIKSYFLSKNPDEYCLRNTFCNLVILFELYGFLLCVNFHKSNHYHRILLAGIPPNTWDISLLLICCLVCCFMLKHSKQLKIQNFHMIDVIFVPRYFLSQRCRNCALKL